MDSTNKGYAYRCMPLVAANCYGWELLCPEDVSVSWNGGVELSSIYIVPDYPWCVSHFGYGIVTFQIPYLFRTSKEADLMVSGPANRYHENAFPLEGIVETSWAPMTFTMNHRLTKPVTVTFEKDEPICRIIPVARNFLQEFEAQIVEHDDTPAEIRHEHRTWNERRREFLEKLKHEDSDAARAGWEKTYFKRAKVNRLPEFLCSQP